MFHRFKCYILLKAMQIKKMFLMLSQITDSIGIIEKTSLIGDLEVLSKVKWSVSQSVTDMVTTRDATTSKN